MLVKKLTDLMIGDKIITNIDLDIIINEQSYKFKEIQGTVCEITETHIFIGQNQYETDFSKPITEEKYKWRILKIPEGGYIKILSRPDINQKYYEYDKANESKRISGDIIKKDKLA